MFVGRACSGFVFASFASWSRFEKPHECLLGSGLSSACHSLMTSGSLSSGFLPRKEGGKEIMGELIIGLWSSFQGGSIILYL